MIPRWNVAQYYRHITQTDILTTFFLMSVGQSFRSPKMWSSLSNEVFLHKNHLHCSPVGVGSQRISFYYYF